MDGWIYCLLAIIWTAVWGGVNYLGDYISRYLLKREYSDSTVTVGGFIELVIWLIPFYLLMKRGLQ